MDLCGKDVKMDLCKLTVFWDLDWDFGGKRKWPKGAGGIKKKKNGLFYFSRSLNPLYPVLILQKTHINNLTLSPSPSLAAGSIS